MLPKAGVLIDRPMVRQEDARPFFASRHRGQDAVPLSQELAFWDGTHGSCPNGAHLLSEQYYVSSGMLCKPLVLAKRSSSFFISSACSSSLARICSIAMRVVGSSLPR